MILNLHRLAASTLAAVPAMLIASGLLIASALPAVADEPVETSRPNIVILLADDLGFSDLGCYGGEIQTPNLDSMANDGLRFTQFYNTGRCWPTRSAIMTGYYPQMVRKDSFDEPGGKRSKGTGPRAKRPAWAPLISIPLQEAGYRTYHSGKWHIDGQPTQNGFNRSYYIRDQDRLFSPKRHSLDDRPLPPVERGTGFYATDAIADRTIEFLDEHQQEHRDQPFFAYVCFNVPHFPLQAPPDAIAKYNGVYDEGWQSIREKRFEKLSEQLSLPTTLSEVEPDVGPPYDFPDAYEKLGDGEVNRPLPWKQLTKKQQRFQADKMEIHAAMVDRMDEAIGRVLKTIDRMGQTENTLVVFLSDNGASAEIMVRGDGHDQEATPGSADTHLCLGPGFSNASNTPFRRHKTWVHEGGTATPMIARWPARIRDAGGLRSQPAHVIDFWPTLVDLCGLQPKPNEGEAKRPGASLANALTADQPLDREPIWWLHEGNRGYRDGNLKIVAGRDEPWQLFDLSVDRAETKDLANRQPKDLEKLVEGWERQTERFKEIADNQ